MAFWSHKISKSTVRHDIHVNKVMARCARKAINVCTLAGSEFYGQMRLDRAYSERVWHDRYTENNPISMGKYGGGSVMMWEGIGDCPPKVPRTL